MKKITEKMKRKKKMKRRKKDNGIGLDNIRKAQACNEINRKRPHKR